MIIEVWSRTGLARACLRKVRLARDSEDVCWHHQQRSRAEGRQKRDERKRTNSYVSLLPTRQVM